MGYSHEGDWEYRVVGFICMALGFGLFKLWNWARIVVMFFSAAFVGVYVVGLIQIFVLRPDGLQWGAMALTAFSPVFLLSISSVVYLTRPKVKEQFKTP